MKVLICLLTVMTLGFTSCKKVDADKGKKTTLVVNISEDFEGIEFGIGGNVNFIQSSNTSIQVETTEKVFDVLEIYVENSFLKFEVKDGYQIKNADEIEVKITAPNVHHFTNIGSSNMIVSMDESNNYVDSDILLSGSGNIELNYLNAYDQTISITGSGNISINEVVSNTSYSTVIGSGLISLRGASENLDVNISGSGNFHGFNLLTDITEIEISSSGSCQVHADSLLNVEINGNGSAQYKGYPLVNVSGSGIGAVMDAN